MVEQNRNSKRKAAVVLPRGRAASESLTALLLRLHFRVQSSHLENFTRTYVPTQSAKWFAVQMKHRVSSFAEESAIYVKDQLDIAPCNLFYFSFIDNATIGIDLKLRWKTI